MNLLDTDMLSLLMSGHARVKERVAQAEKTAISIVARIEILQGRFASILKAPDSHQLLQAQFWLEENERLMQGLPVARFNTAAAEKFELLRQERKYRKCGRGDLLTASIALANRATLVTRNVKDFRVFAGLRLENWAD